MKADFLKYSKLCKDTSDLWTGNIFSSSEYLYLTIMHHTCFITYATLKLSSSHAQLYKS